MKKEENQKCKYYRWGGCTNYDADYIHFECCIKNDNCPYKKEKKENNMAV